MNSVWLGGAERREAFGRGLVGCGPSEDVRGAREAGVEGGGRAHFSGGAGARTVVGSGGAAAAAVRTRYVAAAG